MLLTVFCTVSITAIISFVNKNPAQKDIEGAETNTVYFEDVNWANIVNIPVVYSSASTFVIESVDDFKMFSQCVSMGLDFDGKVINVEAETLDFNYEEMLPVGAAGDELILSFRGEFNGGGCCFKNLKIVNALARNYVVNDAGLFGYLASGASIYNLKLDDVQIYVMGGSSQTPISVSAAALCGKISGEVEIYNVQVDNIQIIIPIEYELLTSTDSQTKAKVNPQTISSAYIGAFVSYVSDDESSIINIDNCNVNGFKFFSYANGLNVGNNPFCVTGMGAFPSDDVTYTNCSYNLGCVSCNSRCSHGDNIVISGTYNKDYDDESKMEYKYEREKLTSWHNVNEEYLKHVYIPPENYSDAYYPFYQSNDFNNGCPILMRWLTPVTYQFTVNDSQRGYLECDTSLFTVEEGNPNIYEVQMPSGVYFRRGVNMIGNVSIVPMEYQGYNFNAWATSDQCKWIANFLPNIYSINFENAVDENGVTISGVERIKFNSDVEDPVGQDDTIKYMISHGTEILIYETYKQVDGTNYQYINYKFKNQFGGDCHVAYRFKQYLYVRVNSDSSIKITDNTIIKPKLKLNAVTLTFEKDENSTLKENEIEKSSNLQYSVFMNSTITYSIDWDEDTVSFSFRNSEDNVFFVTYDNAANCFLHSLNVGESYKYDYLDECVNNEISIVENINIYPEYKALHTVTFEGVGNSLLQAIINPIKVKTGESVVGSLNENKKILTYTYNGSEVAKYTANQYYAIVDNEQARGVQNVQGNVIIRPTIDFYACIVTMGQIDSSIGTREVEGDNYSTLNDGIFVVEYGTEVTFEMKDNGRTYVYTFRFGATEVAKVTYKIPIENNEYSILYKLVPNVQGKYERFAILNGIDNLDTPEEESELVFTEYLGENRRITPQFGRKQYSGNLA